ncbi:Ig-like domain-containing protein [Nocardia vaccinii]|uniref:Ig-like domain-containing protein n=1 Tax=Nocardia vaccinii TaxID=1822 RepID=UPI0008364D0E|nr:Ig-like domain-containing protein [Nocardia vaccinii]
MTATGVQLFQQMKDKQDPLVFAPLNSLAFAHKWSIGASYIPQHICDPTTGALLPLPQGWQTLGELQKKAGVDMTPDVKTSDVEGLGSLAPRRTIKTSEGLAIDYTAQEWRKVNHELYSGADLSDTWANSTSGEWRGHKMISSTSDYWSLIVIAFDGIVGSEYYPYWILPKLANTKPGKVSLADGSEIAFPQTLTCYQDSAFVSSDGVVGSFYDFGVAGVGNIPLAKLGGFMQVTAITVSPSTATLAVAGTQQLKVTDSNGKDVTAWSTFSSGTPADATVSSSGLVTAVATGSSVITASYTPDGATTALTGTCNVTVS